MSTILRALKKLEHEKSSRKPDQAELDLEFLSGSPPVPRRSRLKGVFMVILLLACGSAGTYLFMTRADKKTFPLPPAPSPVRQAAIFNTATSARPALSTFANRSSAVSPRIASTSPAQAQQKPAPKTSEARHAKTRPEPQHEEKPVKKQRAPQTTKAPKLPDRLASSASLTVNGIALSDGEKRKAIVNGMPVSIGSMVEGARVEDIQENRVRFSRGNRQFDISVGNTGQ